VVPPSREEMGGMTQKEKKIDRQQLLLIVHKRIEQQNITTREKIITIEIVINHSFLSD
jgi:hypothetical protein